MGNPGLGWGWTLEKREVPYARVMQAKHQRRGTPSSEAPVAVVRIELLGGFRVWVGSHRIKESEWRLKKAKSLIKLLALAPGHLMHRERLMELLWPELGAKAAANNLRQALHLAHRALLGAAGASASSGHLLRRRAELLELCPEEASLWVDVETFEEAAATARRTREPSAYQLVVDLYAGELLPEDLYEEWAENRRRELRRTYLELLVELAGLYEEREEFGSAIEALRRVLRSEPAHEEAHVGLMRLYALLGRRLEALGQYERLREALSRELGAKPSAASRRLYEKIVAGGQLQRTHPPRVERPSEKPEGDHRLHNLPEALTSFVGRGRELVEVKRALATSRLLTLTGTGGCGKTRLALEVARDLIGAYLDGVWLVELAGLSEPELVIQQVADVLGVREQPDRSLLCTLEEALRAKKVLLVLDNCEHLVDACAHLVEALLLSCPGLRVLATSREALRTSGEAIFRVPSLSLPEGGELTDAKQSMRYESVRLFVERARYRDPAFVLTQQNAPAVAEICRKLEGIPLAVELAAARVGTLDAERISERLEDSLKLLTTGSRTALPRHQTLRGTLDWSYELLNEPERKLFRRLSVFAGGWTLEAAEAVGAGTGIEKEDVLDLLARLVDKSLVIAEATTTEGQVRYRLLEPVRQYGRERLEESKEADAIRDRHAAFFLALAEVADPELRRAQQATWVGRLKREYENLRVALSWALESGQSSELGLRLSVALGEFWVLQGHAREGLGWLEAALLAGGGEASPARAKALAHAGYIAWQGGTDVDRATAFGEEALTLSRKLGDKRSTALALRNLGFTRLYRMELEEARALYEEALALWRELRDTPGTSRTLQEMGRVSVVRHDLGQAEALYEESLTLARKAEDKVGVAFTLVLGALVALGRGDHGRVRGHCEESLGLARQLGNPLAVTRIVHVLAASAGSQGLAVRSARLWGAAESLREALGRPALGPAERHLYGPYIAGARTKLGEAAWEAAWAEGKAMTQEAAIEYALSEKEPVSSEESEETAAGIREEILTRREQDVAVLLARGLTNRQIATELILSEHTVTTHARNILKKLGLHSRTEIAAWVTRR